MDESLKRQIQLAIEKTVEQRLSKIVKTQATNFAVATIEEINYSSQRARVTLTISGNSRTRFIPYPNNLLEPDIGVGQTALILSTDPSGSGSYIVAVFGGFGS